MTVHEIEETLHTLETRHPGLNEVMLVTLLRAGGWEERTIEEARALFRSNGTPDTAKVSSTVSLPPLQIEPVFEPVADEKHLLMEHNEAALDEPSASVVEEPKKHTEPQSLVVEQGTGMSRENKKTELPHNLPLRPFETSEHIWPFSRYKSVFFGEDETPSDTTKVETSTPAFIPTPTPTPVISPEIPREEKSKEVVQERIVERIVERPVPVMVPVPAVHYDEPVPMVSDSESDEKLIVLACVMLLIVLLLLGYMYSNGRL